MKLEESNRDGCPHERIASDRAAEHNLSAYMFAVKQNGAASAFLSNA